MLCWGCLVVLSWGSALRGAGPASSIALRELAGAAVYALHLDAGDAHTCIIDNSNGVRCWGAGANGRLGLGFTSDVLAPSGSVTLGLGITALAVATGAAHTCVIDNNSDVRCWGAGADGRLGLGSTADVGGGITFPLLGPASVNLGAGVSATALSAGGAHTCIIDNSNATRCWGRGANGRLGYGSTANVGDSALRSVSSAGVVALGGSVTAKSLSSGGAHTCITDTLDAVHCWGMGTNGRLGYGSTADVGSTAGSVAAAGTVNLGTAVTASQVVAAGGHTCVIDHADDVRCWGSGADAQLGYGDLADVGDGAGLSVAAAGVVQLSILASSSPTATPTPTLTPSSTAAVTASPTASGTAAATPAASQSAAATPTASATASAAFSVTAVLTPTAAQTADATLAATAMASASPTPSVPALAATASQSAAVATPLPTSAMSSLPTSAVTLAPSLSASTGVTVQAMASVTASASASNEPAVSAALSASPSPTDAPTSQPSASSSAATSGWPSFEPSASASPLATATGSHAAATPVALNVSRGALPGASVAPTVSPTAEASPLQITSGELPTAAHRSGTVPWVLVLAGAAVFLAAVAVLQVVSRIWGKPKKRSSQVSPASAASCSARPVSAAASRPDSVPHMLRLPARVSSARAPPIEYVL